MYELQQLKLTHLQARIHKARTERRSLPVWSIGTQFFMGVYKPLLQ